MRKRLQSAYNRPEYKEALAALDQLHDELEERNQSAAASLEEGIEETLTLHRLGVYGVLGRSFKTTNCLESVNALVEERCAKVDHWKNSSQRQRWLATALVDIEPRLRSIIVGFLLDYLGVQDVSYLDIGAYDPILINNTYYFYKKGHRGVLVEPNVTMCEKLESIRPEDTTLAVGIGVDAVTDAEYYVMSEPSWSTFSRAEAEHQEQITNGEVSIKEVRTLPLLNINNVMDEHFGGAPTFLSIDAEGWHIAILKSVDYDRFRPKAICIETLVSGASNTIPEIPVFMETKGYIARGGSFVNTIFVDSGII